MEEVSLNMTIGNRSYPLTIKKNREAMMQRAEKMINDRMKVYQANFSVKDQQDLLAMCLLEITTKLLESEQKVSGTDDLVGERLEEMERFLSQYLSKY